MGARSLLTGPILNPRLVPTVPVELDRSHPLAQGLFARYIFGGAFAGVDLTGQQGALAPVNSPPFVLTDIGVGQAFNGANQYSQSTTNIVFGSTATLAVSVQMRSLGSSENSMLVQTDDDANSWGFALEFNNSNPRFQTVNDSAALVVLNGSSVLSVGRTYRIVATYNGSQMNLYVNGQLDPASPVSQSGNLRGPGRHITIAGLGLTGGRYANAIISDVTFSRKAWSAAEAAWDAAEPFIGLRPVVRRTYFTAASGSSFTAAPGFGALALAGQAPTLTAGASLAPSAGSIAISGNAPVLSAGAAIAPGLGTITYTGQGPTLSAGATMTPAPGSITATGLAPTITASATLSPSPGLVSMAGYQVTFSASGTFTAAPGAGSVSVTGYLVTLSAGAAIAPTPGALSVAGHQITIAGFSVSFTATPGAGMLAFSGLAPIFWGGSPPQRTSYSPQGSRTIIDPILDRTVMSPISNRSAGGG